MTAHHDKAELWLEWGFRALLAMVVGMLAYFGQELHKDQVESVRKLHEIELWRAETAGNRFTSSDAMRLQSAMTDTHVALDKRITRNEDAILSIKAQLDRIEAAIETLKAREVREPR